MGRMKPVIGVTTSRRSGWRIYPLIALNLWLAGGRGRRWDSGREADIGAVDGLIVGGGDDISPELYEGEIVVSARLDPARDALERRLVRAALAAGKPVLGICRGAQMLNVALGGDLHQDAYRHHADSRFFRTILPRKDVEIAPDTLLARIAGAAPMRVNALHSQAVRRLGAGLRVAAIKGTGTGAFGDMNAYADAGAQVTLDFTDAGMATTYLEPLPRIRAALDTLLAEAAARDCDVAVVEIADGVLQRETAALLADPAARSAFDGFLYACPDALSAVGGVAALAPCGVRPHALTGLISRAPLATREAEAATGLRVISREALRDPAEAMAALRMIAARSSATVQG